jgi:tripartite-type tricarboxylate transporter receptor subunit TctC
MYIANRRNLMKLAKLLPLFLIIFSSFNFSAFAFPDRPVKIIVGFAPGGSDISARLIAQRLSEIWGQPVVIDNKPGAAGNIGAETVAKAAPDGYTLLLFVNSYTINTSLYKGLNWDATKDFNPIARYALSPMVVVVNNALPIKNFSDFVAYAKANNGKLNFGSAGTGTAPHLAAELFTLQMGLTATHIPYKGSAPSVTALVSNEVQFSFGAMSAFDGMVKQGRLKALAVTTAKRFSELPDLPTVAESGLAGFDADIWYGLVAPAKTPASIIKIISDDLAKVIAEPDMQEKLKVRGLEPAFLDSTSTTELIKRDVSRWKDVIYKLKLSLD